jgi:hypothetical protein
MPAESPDDISVEQQAIKALSYLNEDEKSKVLEYIDSLITLHEVHNDQRSAT